jgi:uncharacterized protein (TIGR04552 family)
MLVENRPHVDFVSSLESAALAASKTDQRIRRELLTLRLLLAGESVIDQPRFEFSNRAEVDRFLRLNQFDTDNPLDLARLRELFHEAVDYLTHVHGFRVPAEVEQVDEIHDLFLLASNGERRAQRFAAMVLKVIHIANHLTGHELSFATPYSEAELTNRLGSRVFTVIDRMRASGIHVIEFAGGKKQRRSIITKLLSKRSTLTTQVFDRARFAITVEKREELVPALLHLARNLFPASYVIPEQSNNSILTAKDVASAFGLDRALFLVLWGEDGGGLAPEQHDVRVRNEFSGPTYRSINFVAEIPLRIDDLVPAATPAIAFARAEIQLFDRDTAVANEAGENSHQSYKRRQAARVRVRLEGAAAAHERNRKMD